MSAACTIRRANDEDLPEIQRLLSEAGVHDLAEHYPNTAMSRLHLLVLDAPDGNGLAGVAVLVMEGRKGKLALLAVDLRYQGLGIEDRLIGVSEALCRAFGARNLERSSRAHRI